jgi:hypothetical protein
VRQLSSRFYEQCIQLTGVVKKTLVLEGEAYGQAAHDGGPLRVRRLQKFGRLELLQILNDQPAWWFVMLRSFDPKRDLAPGLIDPARGNVWRFLDLERAKARFDELSAIPWCLADEQKRQKQRGLAREHILKVRTPFPKKLRNPDRVAL